ncbi:6771_t:CDS:10 [Paraglomus brasilianum]|uniref:ubiquitinyl hydrolase 1 n=1 Tax=Paraglomus brasilianum TaxID=144538 RepID=A0A9N9AA37_9GLOM|nr:6771_t:CDS:10 [Paraglomus brasilianum]
MTTMWTKIFLSPSAKAPTDEQWNSNSEKYFGLENILYFCKPFRECVINYPTSPQPSPTLLTMANGASVATNGTEVKVNGEASSSASAGMEDSLFGALKDLFIKINGQKKRSGVVAPHQFVAKLKSSHVQFQSTMHQDAHEFFNWILNAIIEQQKKMEAMEQADTTDGSSTGGSSTGGTNTWVHKIFEGVLTNEIKCLTCETVTSKDETFFELPLNIEQNSSVTSCLRKFSASEMLRHRDKFFCDACCGLQEAEKRMKIKKLPNVLALHLKRFKVQEFQDKLKKVIKLSYRVVFPFELRLFNTCDDTENPDRLYELYAVCVHIGSGLQHGHYVALIKNMGQWRLFDDDAVEIIDEEEIQKYSTVKGSGYMLFYQAVDLDYASLGLQTPDAQALSSEFELSEQSNAREPPPSPAMTNGTVETISTNGTTLVSSASSVISTSTVTFASTNEPSTPAQSHEERHQPPVRENSSTFAEWSNALLSTRRRKDHNTPDRRKSHDKKEDDDKKRSSQLDPVPEVKGGKEGGPSKKDKKIEKEEKKKEKKQRLSEKYKFSTNIINGNAYQAKPAST